MLGWVAFFFQAEDGIRDLVRSRGLGDVYKRQALPRPEDRGVRPHVLRRGDDRLGNPPLHAGRSGLSLIHI